MDPITAVTHADPYPYYAELVARRPIHRDDTLGLWVACSAAAVTAVLKSETARVRPATEPVPTALLGSPAGDVFGHLVRMNDGAAHLRMKPGVSAKLAMIDPARVTELAATWAQRLPAERVTELSFRLPVYVVASLVGVAPDQLPQTEAWVSDFVRCLAPGGTPEQLERGKAAAGHLVEMFLALLHRPALDAGVANTIGYLSQAYEATAGLIGNTLVALARHPQAGERAQHDRGFLWAVVREVVRHDPPVQNTRRFMAEDDVVLGQTLKEGDTVLVVLAAANRDPAANPHPERFDPSRTERQAFTFGVGPHACPGEAIATLIAHGAVERLLASGVRPERLVETMTYRPSVNTRIPLFGAA